MSINVIITFHCQRSSSAESHSSLPSNHVLLYAVAPSQSWSSFCPAFYRKCKVVFFLSYYPLQSTVCITKANVNQAESLGTRSMLIGWNGLLLVDTSATARPVAKHPFSYLNTCKCRCFTIAIKARKKIVMTPNCSQCVISRLKM